MKFSIRIYLQMCGWAEAYYIKYSLAGNQRKIPLISHHSQ